jgi:Chalcone isomerase-like
MKKIILLFSVISLLSACGGDSEKNNQSHPDQKNGPVHTEKSKLTVEGVNIPEKISLDTNSLILNGTGVRNKFHLKVYVAALYLPSKSNSAEEILNKNEPQAIVLHITSILMTSGNMSKYISEGFYRSTGGKTAPIQKQIDLALSIFNSEPVSKYDKFEMFYLPEENGVKAYKNGKFLSFIPGGLEFKKAMLGIWLSNDPVDEDLKTGILGLERK